ncbi:acylphosphatase [candidate division MSBL1 archaeon SCGC-AAA259A05]|uniref:Acylphosphatase n=1 Tax=candidate division MSBL1 archaeon SCGC-AAA259A05 TaxID=1698259 RepID=A0A133U3M3_9EURY|nr:acylphosphatase [candidate division MSBL1 archaeon SCGC-AAA259A05]
MEQEDFFHGGELKKRAHVFVSGRVQGVAFRATARKEARKRGVNGWVKNLRDGRVEAVFEGGEDDVEEMIDFCREGSRAANVEDIEVSWEEYKGEFSEFGIRY